MEYENSSVALAVQQHIYDAENPDWSALEAELLKIGFMDIEVFYIMKNVRDGVL